MKKLKVAHLVVFLLTILLLIALLIYVAFGYQVVPVVKGNSDIPYESGQVDSNDDISNDISDKSDIDDEIDLVTGTSNPKYDGEIPPPFEQADIDAIDAFLKSKGEGISVYFEDIHSGNKYSYNDNEKYFIASVIKAPYCMYLYDLASQGKCSLTDEYEFKKEDIQEGTGKLKDTEWEIDELTQKEIPLVLTMRELLSYAIIDSDNTAIELLRKRFNHVGYTEYAMALGLNYKEDISYIVNGKLTAKDAGVYANAIYNFYDTNKYGQELKSDMMKTRNAMITSKNPIARKYGWAEKSFHDMAIVYDEHPYILVILTDHDEGKKEDYELFRDITSMLERMQKQKYALLDNE